jgi:phospholipase C
MKTASVAVLLLLALSEPVLAPAQISNFRHVVVIVQENRTPDNLFQGLCGSTRTRCPTPYDLQNYGFDETGKKILLAEQPLGAPFDPGHSHLSFLEQCDPDPTTNKCRMDGYLRNGCPSNCSLQYVKPADVRPYITMAQQYGWSNFMFQTNQGPSFPAHQFLFGGTSAPDATSDHIGIFAAENTLPAGAAGFGGCAASPGVQVQIIRPPGVEAENDTIFPCFEHNTMADILPAGVDWRYYTPGPGDIWTAPNAIAHICGASGGQCRGSQWTQNVDLDPKDVLKDIANCKLRSVSWVIPSGKNSDHPRPGSATGGPSWVASIVNSIGTSANCDGGAGYWKDTAILVTWDDWGGFYDHEPPPVVSQPQGDYQYGFRVPLLVISAYTPAGYVSNIPHDFGSILRFIEGNFGLTEGMLTFADQRATDDLDEFFELRTAASSRPFVPISAPKSIEYFLNDTTPLSDPDDD